MPATVSTLSKEYLHGSMTATVTLDEQDIDVALVPAADLPDGTTTWTPAEWEGVAGLSRTWRVLVGPTTTVGVVAPGTYHVWSRVTDDPEIPVRRHVTATGNADILTVI